MFIVSLFPAVPQREAAHTGNGQVDKTDIPLYRRY